MSRRVISYSLFGNSRLYCENGLINIELAKKYYPDFRCVFSIAKNCPALSIFQKEDCDVIVMPEWNGIDRSQENWKWDKSHAAMLWRYGVIDDCTGPEDIILMRDCDSHLSERESRAVYEWIDTDYLLSAFYENECHKNGGFMGGMWQTRANLFSNMREGIEEWIDFYSSLNHDYIFIDLVFNQTVLLPMLHPRQILKIGYNNTYDWELPTLFEGESPIGAVENEAWRNQIFNPEEYVKHATV